jgi:hypothetical protein
MLQKEKKLKDKNHFRALGKMYLSAPINEIFKPLITISDGSAEIEIEVKR